MVQTINSRPVYSRGTWDHKAQNGLTPGSSTDGVAMPRRGNCYHNAVMKNFFGHLKEELFHRVRFLSTDALARLL